jgi:nucleoside-diphosphate-sugar epimerase
MQSGHRSVVTGAAGFIGSHLAERLLGMGHHVTGIDSFDSFYPRPMKEANLAKLRSETQFRLVEGDLVDLDLVSLLDGVDYVFHLAAQAGVRPSWGDRFGDYIHNNIHATQRLLEAASDTSLKAFIFASSSSVYGDAECLPTPEATVPRPVSPYGITKLTCEHLCRVYQRYGVPVTIMRYFSVYGPRQRPDMAFRRFIQAIYEQRDICIYGDGEQTRDFTYVSDIVDATVRAMDPIANGRIFNAGSGVVTSVKAVIGLLEEMTGIPALVRYAPAQRGDAAHTAADISEARRTIGYAPTVAIERGLASEIEWFVQSHQLSAALTSE